LKVIDKLQGEAKLFQSMPHGHDKEVFNPDCLVCRAERAEKSIPKKDFTIKDPKGLDFVVKTVTLKRGRYGDCVGWSFGSG